MYLRKLVLLSEKTDVWDFNVVILSNLKLIIWIHTKL